MKQKLINEISWSLILSAVLLTTFSCSRGPKILSFDNTDEYDEGSNDLLLSFEPGNKSNEANVDPLVDDNIHIVEVQTTLPTEKYIYARVKEEDATYWIATDQRDIKEDRQYYYKGSVLQYDFYSKDQDRYFDTIYFVSRIVPADHNLTGAGSNKQLDQSSSLSIQQESELINVEGSVPIADLIKNKESYGGKSIQVSGKCVKVNLEIMGRNWVHIQDGTADDFDLVITTDETIEVGQIVTMTGVVVLDRDYGAGYFYPIIIEGGKLVDKADPDRF